MANQEFKIFVLNPRASVNHGLIVAACRAGAVGVINGEHGLLPGQASAALALISRYGRGEFGLRLPLGVDADWIDAALGGKLSEGLTHLIASFSDLNAIQELLPLWRSQGVSIWLECETWPVPEHAASPDGWWLKGRESGGSGEDNYSFVMTASAASTELPVVVRGCPGVYAAAALSVMGAAGIVLDDALLLLQESPLDADARRIVRRAAQANHQSERESYSQSIVMAPLHAMHRRRLSALIREIRTSLAELPKLALELGLLGPDSPLAAYHGTALPLVQGPMTHVSDRPAFAVAVAESGALPMIAASLIGGDRILTILNETRELLGGKPWAVGLLGFVPPDILQQQREALLATRPSFALIAGGRPEQAADLEAVGIPAYLHVPSPRLLEQFLADGARHFVFEGRECGGHIGPLASLVLWDLMVETLLHWPFPAGETVRCSVLFAGGIHDRRTAAAVMTLAAPLAARGIRVGMLMGTAYCLTREAVRTGAVLPRFQEVVRQTGHTLELENAPGMASRVAATAVAECFGALKSEMIESGKTQREIKDELEKFNLGRLRLATRGQVRVASGEALRDEPEDVQLADGMYMIGQAAQYLPADYSLADLHHETTVAAQDWLQALMEETVKPDPAVPSPADIAIVGIGCVLPGATGLEALREMLLSGASSLREVPEDRWDAALYFDSNRQMRDRVYSRWGGFLEEQVFDPLKFGIPPAALRSIDPMQLLALLAVAQALEDADEADNPDLKKKTAVMLGFSGGLGELGLSYASRAELARLGLEDEGVLGEFPEWTEDSFAGLLPNVIAGRVANRFDFHGINVTIDAACASSLAAIYLAVGELMAGRADRVVAGGIDTLQNPFGFLCFSKTQALSPSGQCRTFDSEADGIAISEGSATVVLKRLADAERDGDRIYAVIKGVGSASDGRVKGLTAPLPAGQCRAIERAWAMSGLSPASCGLWEAHGTGTVAGDAAELTAAAQVLEAAGAAQASCAIGSIKTSIGHTKAAAGVSGLIKAALALHDRVFLPHRSVTRPHPLLSNHASPFYLLQHPRPWLATEGLTRRAGVSAFGFGGTNFHVVLEAYDDDYRLRPASCRSAWPAELFVWKAASPDGLVAAAKQAVADAASGTMALQAARVWRRSAQVLDAGAIAAFVAENRQQYQERLHNLLEHLEGNRPLAPGIRLNLEFRARSRDEVAFLFPGQGSQYPDMCCDLSVHFPEAAAVVESFSLLLRQTPTFAAPNPPLDRILWPAERFSEEDERTALANLTQTQVAQPALGAVSCAMLAVLDSLGISPGMTAGHSYGEFVALHAAGAISQDDLARISEARGRSIVEAAAGNDLGTMLAVAGAEEAVSTVLGNDSGVVLANLNSPNQTILSGSRAAIAVVEERIRSAGLECRPLSVAAAFHSPLVAPARTALATILDGVEWQRPACLVFNNATAAPHPEDPAGIRTLMTEHLVEPVRFAAMLAAMRSSGASIFVEIGPKRVLTDLVRACLGNDPGVVMVAMDGRSGMQSFLEGLAALAVAGVSLDLSRLYRDRDAEPVVESVSQTHWLVHGGGARRVDEPRRRRGKLQVPEKFRPPMTPFAPMEGDFSDLPNEEDSMSDHAPPPLDPVLSAYHETMRQFLGVQERIMMAYLSGRSPGEIPAPPARIHEPYQSVPVTTPTAEIAAAVTLSQTVPEILPQAPANPPVPEKPMATAMALDEENLARLLKSLVAERTGYPEDMLGMEQDLEADLGVDSIKRAEILGAFRKALPQGEGERLRLKAEQLSEAHTMRAIVAKVQSILAVETAVHGEDNRPFEHAGAGQSQPGYAPLPRFVLRAYPEPMPVLPSSAISLPQGNYGILSDDAGLAEALAEAMRQEAAIDCVKLDFKRVCEGSDEISALVEKRPIGLIVVLTAGFSEPLAEEPLAWHRLEVLYPLLRHLASSLRNKGRILFASCSGGLFGRAVSGMGSCDWVPAALTGLAKTLSREWPGCIAKAVDLDPGVKEAWIGILMNELSLPGGRREVGYPAGMRTIFRTERASLLPPLPGQPVTGAGLPEQEWVILVAGGARGVTAQSLSRFAACGVRLVLVGRTAFPESEEGGLSGCSGAEPLRAYFIAQARATGATPRPAEIDRQVTRVMQEREIRASLDRLVRLGAKVEYLRADLRDEQSVSSMVADLYERYGRIDGVVFGAGVIEDARIENKTTESVRRVMATKADAAWQLCKLLRPEGLRFCAFFSSVAGRFGNPGQSDYAVANELLARMAWEWHRRWQGRVKVVAIHWGPWETTEFGTGMVTDATRAKFEADGVRLVDPAGGADFLWRECVLAPLSEVEAIAGNGEWEERESALSCPDSLLLDATLAQSPLLSHGQWLEKTNDGSRLAGRVKFNLNLADHPWLDEHRLDGQPVLPFVGALALMAEGAEALSARKVTEVMDARMFQGIIVSHAVNLVLIIRCDGDSGEVVLGREDEDLRPSYRCRIRLADEFVPGTAPVSAMEELPSAPLNIDVAYRQWLFHGPLFQVLCAPARWGDSGMSANLKCPDRRGLFPGQARPMTFDIPWLDGALQSIAVWTRARQGALSLPLAIRRLTRYDAGPFQHNSRLILRVISPPEEPNTLSNVTILGLDGKIHYEIEGIEGAASQALNRLGGQWAGGEPEGGT